MTMNAPWPTFAATAPVLMSKEDSNVIVLKDSLQDPCKSAKMLTNARKWATSVLSDATTSQDLSVVFVRTATLWQQMVVTAKTWTSALRRPIIANLLAKI